MRRDPDREHPYPSEPRPGCGPSHSRQRLRRWLKPRLPFLAIGAHLLLLTAVLLADRIFVRVQAGEAAVLWNRFSGTRVDRVFGEGLHVISPLDRMTRYEVRRQVARHSLSVLSSEGLGLRLDLAIRYQPEYDLLGLLHERVGPDYLARVVIPQTESVLRKELGNATAEAIYTNRDGLLTRAMLAAMDEIGRNFVAVDDIVIRRIELPATVRTAIEEKLVQRQLLLSYAYRRQTALQEAKRKRIEADGIADYQRTVSATLSDRLLDYQGIRATRELAASANEKTVVIGAGGDLALPILLGGETGGPPRSHPQAPSPNLKSPDRAPPELREDRRDPSDPSVR